MEDASPASQVAWVRALLPWHGEGEQGGAGVAGVSPRSGVVRQGGWSHECHRGWKAWGCWPHPVAVGASVLRAWGPVPHLPGAVVLRAVGSAVMAPVGTGIAGPASSVPSDRQV